MGFSRSHKTIWLWGWMLSLMGMAVPAAPAWADCDGKVVVLQPGPDASTAAFKAWMRKQLKDRGDSAPFNDEDLRVGTLYAVDLDNDGEKEFVFTRLQGSGGYLLMKAYKRSPDGSFSPHDPPTPMGLDSSSAWSSREYSDPSTQRRDSLFYQMCGKTYMSFMGDAGYGSRASYLWDSTGTHPACDAAWTAYIRAGFKRLYDAKEYAVADRALASFATQCNSQLEANTRAWVANDLAITQYKLGEPQRCLEYVQQAKESPEVLSAALYNEKLCGHARENRSTDFSWVLDTSLTNSNQLVIAGRFQELLHALVPSLKQGDPDGLRQDVTYRLTGPDTAKKVEEGRYVSTSGFTPHSATSRALIWVDVKQRLGLVALNESDSVLGKEACAFTVASRLVGPKDIPAPFWAAFKRWYTGVGSEQTKMEPMSDGCVNFVAPDGTVSRIVPP